MEGAFDPAKDMENRSKHGISLQRANDFDFQTAMYEPDDSQDYGEARWKALGWLDAKLHSLTFTERGGVVRAISLRKASRPEHISYAKES